MSAGEQTRRAELVAMAAAVASSAPDWNPEDVVAQAAAILREVDLELERAAGVDPRLGESERFAEETRALCGAAANAVRAFKVCQFGEPLPELERARLRLAAAVDRVDPFFEVEDPRANGWVNDRGLP